MTFTNPHATWVHFQNLMELYWPKESLQVTGTTLPAPRTTLCLHTSAGSARGILDSAENSLPLASYFIKKLARDQKKKKKKRPCSHTRLYIPDFHCTARTHKDLKFSVCLFFSWNSPFLCSPLQHEQVVLKRGVVLNVPNCISWSGSCFRKKNKKQIWFFFVCFNGASDLITPGGHASGRCSWPGSGLWKSVRKKRRDA